MRGTTTELDTPYPLGSLLPAVLQEDELLMRFTAAVDLLLAPAISSLDCLGAYLDPALAPADFLGWLAGWVGAELDETWPVGLQRTAVAQAVELQRDRGTIAGLRRQLALITGADVEVTDTGGVTWSAEPVDGAGPVVPPRLEVVVRGNNLDAARLAAVVEAAKPAHVAHTVRVEPSVTDVR
ncbi:phage tail P2-like protein [Kribbella amoyensis]|uniref:Phage tail P2-like protein n=1 Tax=Kribbella amoyensis TaxID=996641 RepID=A0A561BKI1_9ACTN|nr:phage tail protein I [Kribbella amoyensis]TWD79384.1 phage tail P2-like protein [Kribbella amoyensis]